MTSAPWNPDWLLPQWPAAPHVRALCTTRAGGVSQPPYDSLNLGTHVGDAAPNVARNRAHLQAALGATPVYLNQVHGAHLLELAPGVAQGRDADGAFTRVPGLACTVMVADCLPILLCDLQGTMVAAVHAGWRGLAGQQGAGVVEQIARRFAAQARAGGGTGVIAWLGPCIGPQAFEVGDDVRSAFVAHEAQAHTCFQSLPHGKWLADLPALARQRLRSAGVNRVYGNDGSPEWCTVANPARFFSHRRDRVSGRQAACIWLE
ncbi:MAG: peptidoglycan editing factor PgeF [Burkholderiales bacterium]|nr:peptidoglycan editing factor PgeF [Burkholderiales bacterium]